MTWYTTWDEPAERDQREQEILEKETSESDRFDEERKYNNVL